MIIKLILAHTHTHTILYISTGQVSTNLKFYIPYQCMMDNVLWMFICKVDPYMLRTMIPHHVAYFSIREQQSSTTRGDESSMNSFSSCMTTLCSFAHTPGSGFSEFNNRDERLSC